MIIQPHSLVVLVFSVLLAMSVTMYVTFYAAHALLILRLQRRSELGSFRGGQNSAPSEELIEFNKDSLLH